MSSDCDVINKGPENFEPNSRSFTIVVVLILCCRPYPWPRTLPLPTRESFQSQQLGRRNPRSPVLLASPRASFFWITQDAAVKGSSWKSYPTGQTWLHYLRISSCTRLPPYQRSKDPSLEGFWQPVKVSGCITLSLARSHGVDPHGSH